MNNFWQRENVDTNCCFKNDYTKPRERALDNQNVYIKTVSILKFYSTNMGK